MCSYLDLKRIKIKAMKKNKKGNHSERSIHLIWSLFWIIYNILGNKGRKKENMYKNQFQKDTPEKSPSYKTHCNSSLLVLIYVRLSLTGCLVSCAETQKTYLWLETSIFSRWLTEKTIFQIYYFFFYNKFYFKKRVN